ncbi:MAG: Mur ligase domain-containing protein, partial [Planctomycetota bacterium]|nr:Mur ligase domain-containing protein [Planctomycetota bacterium]
MKFRIDEIVSATGGRLALGNPSAVASAIVTDSRTLAAGQVFLALRGEQFDGHNFLDVAANRGAAALIIDREGLLASLNGFAGAVVVVRNTEAALADLGRAARARLACPVIAVTGSCGKTTVKEMVGQILGPRLRGKTPPASYNNQIGVPLTLLAADTGDPWQAVCDAAQLVYERFSDWKEMSRLRYQVVHRIPALRDREIVTVFRYDRLFVEYLQRALPDHPHLEILQFSASVTATHNYFLRRM